MRKVFILLIILSYICTISAPTISNNSHTVVEQTEKILPDKTTLTTLSIYTYKNNEEVMHAFYSYPQFLYNIKAAAKLNNFYTNKFFVDYKKIQLIGQSAINSPLSGNLVYAYDHTFETTYHSNKLISILENTYEYAGGTHSDNYLEGNTFSLQTGEVLTLGDLFESSKSETEQKIKNYIIEEINSNAEDYYPDALETISNYSLDSFNYYLKNETLIIFFNPYEIAPYPRGVVEFSFPITPPR